MRHLFCGDLFDQSMSHVFVWFLLDSSSGGYVVSPFFVFAGVEDETIFVFFWSCGYFFLKHLYFLGEELRCSQKASRSHIFILAISHNFFLFILLETPLVLVNIINLELSPYKMGVFLFVIL